MNAITMKLENKQPLVSSSKNKGKDSVVGKKSKNHRKKSSLASTDKDALLSDHGLGCLSGETNYDLNDSKSNNSSELSSTKKSRPKKVCPKRNDKMLTTCGTMHERLQQILSPEVKDKITSILSEVKTLSDVEKLFLYLQLPTGSPFEADPFKIKYQNPLGKKAEEEGMIAITWIQSHLEEDPEVSLPKQEVYDEYQAYCQMTGRDALCAADFGKVMKQIFPSVKPRRLGTRGNSRYCYSGLRKKLKLKSPILPDMNTESENSDLANENIKDEVTSAACHILFEWAEKLLGIKFTSLKELASHLLENMYVDNRSVAAFTVLLEGAPQLMEKGFSNYEGGMKKSDAQVHLQRKIQEKELIKEQKKKLQEQRSNLTAASKNKLPLTKKKSTKSKKSKLPIEKLDLSSDKKFEDLLSKGMEETSMITEVEKTSLEIDTNAFETQIKEEDMDMELVVDLELVTNDTTSSSSVSAQISANKSADNDQNSSLQTEDTATKKSKIILPRSKTPVCVSQTLSNIIIVPSLSQLTEINKPNLIAPKYKRIQPKPLKEDGFSSVARSRAGSLGSTTVIKPKIRTNDGRHSSHAWLQSASSPEASDHNNSRSNSDCTANVIVTSLVPSPQKSNLKKNCFIAPKDKTTEKLKSDIQFSPEGQNSSAFSDIKVLENTTYSQLSNESTTGSILKSNSLNKSSLPFRESNGLKRPLDDSEKALKTKKMLLDTNSSEEVSVFPVTEELSSAIKCNIPLQRPSIQQNSSNEEVSIYEIEGDALNDYYRGSNSQALFATSIQQMENKDCDTKRRDLNKDISQLRMLLEQKMSCGHTNSSILNSLKNDIKTESPTQKGRISFSNTLSSEDGRLSNEQLQTANKFSLNNLCNNNIVSLSFDDDKQIKNISQLDSIEKFLDCHLNQQNRISDQDELISNTEMYLNSAKNNSQQIELELSDFQQGLVESNNGLLSNTDLMSNIEYTPHENSFLPMRVNTYTQVPSVPQSPNTRRRAFNFMPISPSHTPVPDNINISGHSAVSSPVPNQFPRNMMSIGVGPSQPPSNAGSPFVSPRSTPVSTCRSRHSSGQSTSRHTPFQNFDSGVSSVSSSPFISPQPTPVPVSRLRHNSSHASNKTVTFCSVNSPHVINSLSTTNSLGQLRSRHNSGPGGPHMSGSLCTKNTPLSPLVSDHGATSSFVFPPGNEIRFRHNSDSNTTSLSPVSEQTSSSSSCTSNLPDLTSVNELSHSFLNDSAADLLINGNSSNFKQVRQRHASSSVIYSKPYLATKDPFSAEIQNLLKHDQMNGSINNPLSNRSQSVPLHQMLPNFNTYCFYQNPVEDTTIKSHPTTPVMNQVFTFPLLNSNQESAALPAEVLNGDKSFSQATQIEWSGLEGTGDLEVSSARRNLTTLLDPPLSDDLQTTLEDLRDCDNDFSKFAQELELSQTEDGSL